MAATSHSTSRHLENVFKFAPRSRPRFRAGQRVRLVTAPISGWTPAIVRLPDGGAVLSRGGWIWQFAEPVEVLPHATFNVWVEANMELAEPLRPAQIILLSEARMSRGAGK